MTTELENEIKSLEFEYNGKTYVAHPPQVYFENEKGSVQGGCQGCAFAIESPDGTFDFSICDKANRFYSCAGRVSLIWKEKHDT